MATKPQTVATADAPSAIGPYAQAVRAGDWLYVSGQIPLDPGTGALVGDDDIRVATRRVLDNLGAILSAAGADFGRVVKTTVFLRDMDDFPLMNEVYAATFDGPAKPARSCVQAARLPRGVRVEIDAVVWLG